MTSWIDIHEISRNFVFRLTAIILYYVLERPHVAKVMDHGEEAEKQIRFINAEYKHDHRAQQKSRSCDYISTFTITNRRIFTMSQREQQTKWKSSLS